MMHRLDSFLRLAAEQSASDLHFHAGNPPIIRHDGDLVQLPFRTLSQSETERFLTDILSTEQKEVLKDEQQVDFIYVLPDVGRFRANIFVQSQGMGAVFRVIPGRVPSLDELQFPASVRRLTEQQNGLVLVTGPTGSGKTTTLAAIVDEINRNKALHIITIEDPIEYLHTSIKCVVTQREVGTHTESFAAGLRSALRETPDVVVVGEMRDLETTQLALSAAETGVLVLATLHTNSAAKAIDRIIDLMSDETREQARGLLSVVLRGVVAQQLCKRASGEGRVVMPEILLHNFAIAHMIRENKIHQIEAYLQSAALDSGMQSLDASLLRGVEQGLIDVDEALRLARYPDQLRRQASVLREDD